MPILEFDPKNKLTCPPLTSWAFLKLKKKKAQITIVQLQNLNIWRM